MRKAPIARRNGESLTRPVAAQSKVPRKFFMSLRDLSFWAGSARADKLLIRLRRELGDPEAFDKLYRAMPDPWSTTSSRFRYQLLKYQKILALLPERRFQRALDIGCGLGVLTRMLAAHADQVLGIDLSPTAVACAQQLSNGFSSVRFQQAELPDLETLAEPAFDLITMVDTLYYLPGLTEAVLESVANRLLERLAPGGLLLLANHYYFGIDRYSRETRRIHNFFGASQGLRLVDERRHAFYLASLFARNPPHD
jgi:SAM-dependent methyltransferase